MILELHGVSQRPSSLFCSLVPEGSFPGGSPIHLLLKQLEDFCEVQEGPDFTLCLPRIPQDCQVHHCVMTTATLQSLDLSRQVSVKATTS